MPMIQIRNVPDDVHRAIKARAALAGMTMSDFLLRELRKILRRPTRVDLLDRIARLPGVELEPDPATLIREERERR